MPGNLAAALDERLAVVDGLDEPLAAGHDLQRAIALLVELDVVVIGLGSPGDRRCRAATRRSWPAPSSPQTRQLVIGLLGSRRRRRSPSPPRPRHPAQRAIGLDDRADRQLQLAPPGDVGGIAECADHGDAAALFRIGQCMCQHRHPHAEDRRHDVGAKQRLGPRIVRMRNQGHAGRDQFRPGRLDGDDAAAIGLGEVNPMVRTRLLAVFQFAWHGRPEIHVPQRRGFDLVRQALGEMTQKHDLRHPLGGRPIVA